MKDRTANLKPIQKGERRNPEGSSRRARANATAKREARKIVGDLCVGFIESGGAAAVAFWERFLLLGTAADFAKALKSKETPVSVIATIQAILKEQAEGRAATLGEIKKRVLGTQFAGVVWNAGAPTPPTPPLIVEVVSRAESPSEEAETDAGGEEATPATQSASGFVWADTMEAAAAQQKKISLRIANTAADIPDGYPC